MTNCGNNRESADSFIPGLTNHFKRILHEFYIISVISSSIRPRALFRYLKTYRPHLRQIQ